MVQDLLEMNKLEIEIEFLKCCYIPKKVLLHPMLPTPKQIHLVRAQKKNTFLSGLEHDLLANPWGN